VVGDGNFGTGTYAVLNLDASTTDFPVIAVSLASMILAPCYWATIPAST
jgi:hypothetical protein